MSITYIHDHTLTPYFPEDKPIFRVRTWYGGVSIAPGGQSMVKLGYKLEMDGVTVLACVPGKEDYIPAYDKPFEDEAAFAFMMGYLTNDFLIEDLIAAATGAEKELLQQYKLHLGALWDSVVLKFGEKASYGM